MSLPLAFTAAAETDLAEIWAWYEAKREGLGDRFMLSVEAAFEHIRRAPKGSLEVHPGIRRTGVRKFPYGVFHRLDPDRVTVIAVYHNKRHPRGWQLRAEDR